MIIQKDADGDESTLKVDRATRLRFLVMRDFIQYKRNQHADPTTPFGFHHIVALKADDFNNFHTGTHAELFINANPPPVTSLGSKQYTPAELFKKIF